MENQPTTEATGPIEVSGGSPVTFAELEAVEQKTKKDLEVTAKKEAQIEKLKQKELKGTKKASEEKEDDVESVDDETEEEVSEEEETEEGEEENEEDEKQTKKEPVKKAKDKKLIKAKTEEGEIDLDPQAKVPVKIDGKDFDVSIEELRSHFSGKVVWDQKFRELNVERQRFMNQKQKIDKEINEIYQVAQTDPLTAFFVMAEKSGIDPVTMQINFMNSAGNALETWKNLSDTERKLFETELRNKYLTKRTESEKLERESATKLEAVSSHVNQIQEAHQIDPEVFWNTFEQLEALQKQGKLNVQDISADLVAEVIVTERNYNALKEGLAGITDSEQRLESIIGEMLDVGKKNPELSPTDLVDIAKEVYGKTKAKTLTKRILKNSGEKVAQKPQAARNPAQEPVFFDDL